ncbi:type I toxin-antitoxin system Ibs family toxin, partial [Escherichia coli]
LLIIVVLLVISWPAY